MDDLDDPADLDGDGEFDAVDMMVLEDGEQEGSGKSRTGCCLVLSVIGSSVSAGWWVVGNYLA